MNRTALFRFLRGLTWTLLPILAIGLVLHFSAAPFEPNTLESMPAALSVVPPPPSHPVSVRLLHADGTPAKDGVVLFFAPETASATMNADGLAVAEMVTQGELQFLAFAPGHALLEASQASSNAQEATPFRLKLLPEPEIRPGEKLQFLPRQLTLLDQQEQPLANVLVLARVASRYDSEPWIAFTDTNGIANFPEATATELRCEAFAPGMPTHRAARLAEFTLASDLKDFKLSIPVCRVQLNALTPQSLLSWKRIDLTQRMPLTQIPNDGKVILGPFPPGLYRIEVDQRSLEMKFHPGLQIVDFSATATLNY